MKLLALVLLTGCISTAGISVNHPKEKRVEGVLEAKVVKGNYQATKERWDKLWREADKICHPKKAIAEFDSFADFSTVGLVMESKTIYLRYICLD